MKNSTKQKGSYYFEMLTTEEQANFRNNVVNGGDFTMEQILDSPFSNFMRFVGSCFSFKESPEGPEYWSKIASSARDGVENGDSMSDVVADLIKKLFGASANLPDLFDEENKMGLELLLDMEKEHIDAWKKEFLTTREDEINSFLKMRYESVAQMLQCSFRFSDSEKGREYWLDVCDKYDSKAATEELLKDLGINKEDESN